ncbi:DUF4435 domain-containing protein [Alteromonas macleodii]|uniref:DUF4435 domain-containing protein n=1 Tax=Alteromonas macleodii TaxID=28108 RepID=UPI000286F2DC|nr:DUF4435 domain-containing protein [Alteromonas macleodii]AFT78959.1 hypothetical protein AMBLS11_11930 [Alteromonas macleodii str. 'Black Sea 11']NKW89513.1 DUF4435 domain-containing protein [Alteromonadaceae bacterium A_SAG4]NKX18451.1 DUF4435 domain-containing protein [Alteromonadaceae bacterium A_SAG5]NKX33619.1 DUF4435 domain-containing protein [Alteromonadaceae bacterium A_SAG3]
MADLTYSADAHNVLSKFYNADKMVYVEGDDDVLFWEFIFNKFSNFKVKVQGVGGKPELEKYIKRICDGEINSIAAMDSDFSIFDSDEPRSNVISTCGYSIENTLISPSTIRDVIRAIGRLPQKEVPIDICGEWLRQFIDGSKALIFHDVQNYILGSGLLLSLDNCSRFLISKTEPFLCSKKIEKHIESIGSIIDEGAFHCIQSEVDKHPSGCMGLTRGHYLFSATLAFVSFFIRNIRGKASISNEALFGALILAFEKHFDDSHEHYSHYQSELSRIVA